MKQAILAALIAAGAMSVAPGEGNFYYCKDGRSTLDLDLGKSIKNENRTVAIKFDTVTKKVSYIIDATQVTYISNNSIVGDKRFAAICIVNGVNGPVFHIIGSFFGKNKSAFKGVWIWMNSSDCNSGKFKYHKN